MQFAKKISALSINIDDIFRIIFMAKFANRVHNSSFFTGYAPAFDKKENKKR